MEDHENTGAKPTFVAKKEDTFKILVATDCHLGYEENDPNIGEDSFKTFEEILIKATEKDADFILLGGDLFHFNNPTQKSMNVCMELLRKYTMGNKEVYFELLSNAAEVFSNTTQTANYLDENLNISIPVFSIHGNHDDPSGTGRYSCLDTLSSAGLVNYFGKWTDLTKVVIKPILLRKGKTKIALYGLSHIKDDRLCRLFLEDKVTLIRPKEDADSWVNILVLHQNRANRGHKRNVDEKFIPKFINLVIWGHEHDCEIDLFQNTERGFYVCQPGSSVATSLSEGETIPKHVGLFRICEDKISLKKLKLNTVRPFIYESVDLNDVPVTTAHRERKSEEIKNFCAKKVNEMIEASEKLLTGHPSQPKLPLIRLRCDFSDETQLFNLVKFGQLFYKRVANPNGDIVKFKKLVHRAVKKENEKIADVQRLNENYQQEVDEMESFSTQVNNLIKDYFTNSNNSRLLVLDVKDMADAIEGYMEKDDITAVETVVDNIYKRKTKKLVAAMCETDEQVKTELEKIRDEEDYNETKKEEELNEKYEVKTGKKINQSKIDSGSDTDEYDANEAPAAKANSSRNDVNNQSKTAGRAPRANTSNRSFTIISDDDMSDGDKDEETGKGKGRGRGRGRARGAGGGKGSRGGRGRGQAAAVDKESSSSGKKKQAPKTSAASSRGARRQPLSFNTTNKNNASNLMYDDDSD